MFIVRFGPDGTTLWARRFGDDDDQDGWDIAFASDGSMYVTGEFDGTMDLGPGQMTSNDTDLYVAKFLP